MYKLIPVLILALTLSGCANMTPGQKKAAWVVAGVVVVGAIAASQSGSSEPTSNCVDTIGIPSNNPGNWSTPGCP